MVSDNKTSFSEQPEIVELLQVLDSNKLDKEKESIESLVSYLENMEDQFGKVLDELVTVREQLSSIQDTGVKAAVTHIVEKTEHKVQDMRKQVHRLKTNLLCSAKQAVTACKEKGITALKKAVEAMKIDAALSHMKNGFGHCADSMEKGASNLPTIRDELNAASGHIRNAGRTLMGKPVKEAALKQDKGILFRIEKIFSSCSKQMTRLADLSDHARKQVKQLKSHEAEKPSVKSELNKIKRKNAGKATGQPVKEKAR